MSNLQANVPLVNVPFVDKNGNVTEAWFLFLIQLWRRTGGTNPSTTLTIKDVLALEETFAPTTAPKDRAGALDMTFAAPAAAKQQFPDISSPGTPSNRISDMIFAPIVREMVDETFSSGTDFTPGTTTVLTLKESFGASPRLWVFFDGVFQGDDQYTLSGVTLTFTSAIPLGTNKVYVKGMR